ncbi:MAG TPA: hypothetical protein VFG37_01040 [Planctomycetota bacterium]|jgi:hypothetical protein|nr:hypothetical protein [Planctomycetota bacterium]
MVGALKTLMMRGLRLAPLAIFFAVTCARDITRMTPTSNAPTCSLDAESLQRFLSSELRLSSSGRLGLGNSQAKDAGHLPGGCELSAFNLEDGMILAVIGPFQAAELEPATHVFIHLDGRGKTWQAKDVSVHWASCVSSRWRDDVTGTLSVAGDSSRSPSIGLQLVVGNGVAAETLNAFVPELPAQVTAWHKQLISSIAARDKSVKER